MKANIPGVAPIRESALEETSRSVVSAATEQAARQRLELHPHIKGHVSEINIQFENDMLVLSGCVPTFYLKQLVQEALRGLRLQLQNNIDVTCCDGFSSVYKVLPFE